MEHMTAILEGMQQKAKNNTNTGTFSDCKQRETEEKFDYLPLHPNKPIQEGVCPLCRGEKIVKIIQKGIEYFGNCPCLKKEIAQRQLEKAGIAESVKQYTFDTFQTEEVWQERLKQKALQFLSEKQKWFFVGGQVGCGKTHICTAILNEFLNMGYAVKYIMWANEIVKLKANKMDEESYNRLIYPLQKTDVLYIDDFFKTEKGKKPSESDIKTAFEIINYRYVTNAITIFSTEKTIDDLIEIDEALGSRIHQKTKGYRNIIRWETGRNWRLKE